MSKAIKSFTKMVNAKVSKKKEKAKRHTDLKGMFKTNYVKPFPMPSTQPFWLWSLNCYLSLIKYLPPRNKMRMLTSARKKNGVIVPSSSQSSAL